MAAGKRPTKSANKNYVATFGRYRVETHRGGYRIRHYDRSKKATVDAGFHKDRDEAIKMAQELAHEAAVRGPVSSSSATIAILGEKVLDPNLNLGWSANTRTNWESLFRQHIANIRPGGPDHAHPIGNRLARDVTASDLGAFIRDKAFKEGLSRSMLTKLIQFLKKIEQQAIIAGIWQPGQNPVTGLTVPDGAGGKATGVHLLQANEIPTDQQVQDLRAALNKIDVKYAIMCDIAAHCGLRLGELLALRQDDISLARRTIRVERQVIEEKGVGPTIRSPKTAAGTREVNIPKVIIPALRSYHRKLRPGQLMFTDSDGKYIRRANFSQVLNGRISNGQRTSVGVYGTINWPQHFTWHTLRHYAITNWVKNGLKELYAGQMAGHTSHDFTIRRYVGSDGSAAKQANKLF